MPVVTRSKVRSSLDPSTGDMALYSSKKPSAVMIEDSSDPEVPGNPVQLTEHSKRPFEGERALDFSHQSSKPPRKRQSVEDTRQTQSIVNLPWPDIPGDPITHWGCQICSCSQGFFNYPIDACICCGHQMDQHERKNKYWDPVCDYVCHREGLIHSAMELLDVMKVVVIRAGPFVGKSTLLCLLGDHILHKRSDLEPVFIHWRTREERNSLPWDEYLERETLRWRDSNSKGRPRNPQAKIVYLIDEAQRSYEETDFWARMIKGRNTRQDAMFVLVCLYGADVWLDRPQDVESQSLNVDAVQRIELRSSGTGTPCMLFKLEETRAVVNKWATLNHYQVANDVHEYVHAATDGHPGMVGFIVRYFDTHVLKV